MGPRFSSLDLDHVSPCPFVSPGRAHQVGSAIFLRASSLRIVLSRVLMAGLVSLRALMNLSRPSILYTSIVGLMVKVSSCLSRVLKKSVIGFLGCLGSVESKAILLPPM